ncbi:hypothetical protein M0R04_11035 [Candidatus Dojkabacteria bacterium]|jgi:hypothetical protein|nr:hypothetical protein [Candidatus Dojkabacteria bacterium]
MVKISFIIETDTLRQPKLVIKALNLLITEWCGDCYIEAPEGYLTKEDLED